MKTMYLEGLLNKSSTENYLYQYDKQILNYDIEKEIMGEFGLLKRSELIHLFTSNGFFIEWQDELNTKRRKKMKIISNRY